MGITLIEMMIVVAIVAILAAIAAPNLSGFLISNRLDTASNDLLTVMSTARSESIRRGVDVVVRHVSGSAPQEWTKGWEVFVDQPSGTPPTVDRQRNSGEELVRSGQQVTAPLTVYSSRNAVDFIAFTPDGRVDGGVKNVYVFVICHEGQIASGNQSRSRAVIVNDSGRIQLAQTNSSGQPLKDNTSGGQDAVIDCRNP